MTTSLDTRTAPRYVDFDEYIEFQLQRTGHSVKWTDILTAAATIATLFLGYLLVFVVFDHWIVPGGFGYLPRLLMLVALLAGTCGWVIWRMALPWFRRISRLYAARVIEQARPELKSGLMNLVDLRRADRPVPADVLGALEKRAAVTMSHMDVDHVVDRRPLLRVVYGLVAVILLATLYAAFTPKRVGDSVRRALFPAADVEAPTETEIVSVEPGKDVEVLSGTQLEVIAGIRGAIPAEVRLLFSTDDREFVDAPVVMRDIDDTRRRYRAILTGSSGRGIQQDLTYRIVAGDDVSRDYRVTVIQPPSASVDELRYEYPGYMGMEARAQPGGEITGWEGTRVTFTATSNVPVASARILFSNDKLGPPVDIVPMQRLDGRQLTASWMLSFDRSGGYPAFYRIECRGERGQTDPEPTVYTVKILPDRVPEVRLIDPRGDLERPANATVPLLIDARDDFRVRELRLRMRRNGEELPAPVEIFRGNQPSVVDQHEWPLAPHGFQPGDVVSYWVEGIDNREPHANIGRSAERELRIVEAVQPQEAAEQLEADKRRQEQELDRARRDAPPDMNDANRAQPEQPAGDDRQPPENPQQQPMEQPPADEQRGDGAQNGDRPPMDGGNPGEQPQDGQAGRDGAAGEQNASDNGPAAPQDGQNGSSGAGSPPREPGGPGSNGAGGSQQPLNPNNPEDAAQALKEYLRQLEEQQQSDGQNGDQPQDAQPRGGGQQQPGGSGQPDAGQAGPRQPTDSAQSGNNAQPQPGDRGPMPPSGSRQTQPGDEPPPRDGQRPRDTNDTPPSGADSAPPTADRQPGGTGRDGAANPMNPMGGGQRGQPEDQPSRNPGDSTDRRNASEPGDMSQAQNPGENGTPEATDGMPAGTAERRDATGHESGTGMPQDDPQAQPTPAQNDVQRQDGTAPATRPPADGPMGDEPAQPADARRGSDNPNPAQPSPMTKPGAAQQPMPEQQPGPRDGPQTNGRPSRRDDQQHGPDEQPVGPGRPDGQRAEQSDTGEGGMGTETTQGTPGSNRPGPGDMTDQPGANQEAGRQTGRPGDERGPGSSTRPSPDAAGDQPPPDRHPADGQPDEKHPQDGQPRDGQPNDAQRDDGQARNGPPGETPAAGQSPAGPQDGQPPPGEPRDNRRADGQPRDGTGRNADEANPADGRPAGDQPQDGNARPAPGDQPGDNVDPTDRQQPGQSGHDQRNRGGSQPAGGGVPGSGGTQPSNEATPLGPGSTANPEYGREAANMVLKRLRDEIQRGEINEEWLKRTGWTEDQARRFAEQLEDQLEGSSPDSPEELARRRQFDEFLRSLKPSGPGQVRSGSEVRNRQDIESFDPRRQYIPPEYRDIAEEYRRRIFSRESE